MTPTMLHVHWLAVSALWLVCKSGAAAVGRSFELKVDHMLEMQHERRKFCQLINTLQAIF